MGSGRRHKAIPSYRVRKAERATDHTETKGLRQEVGAGVARMRSGKGAIAVVMNSHVCRGFVCMGSRILLLVFLLTRIAPFGIL